MPLGSCQRRYLRYWVRKMSDKGIRVSVETHGKLREISERTGVSIKELTGVAVELLEEVLETFPDDLGYLLSRENRELLSRILWLRRRYGVI